jgi:hypothetical protein
LVTLCSWLVWLILIHIIIIIVVVIIIIITPVIALTQGIYNYIPETNHVSRVYNVTTVLCLQFVLRVMLFFPWNMFCLLLLLLFSRNCRMFPWTALNELSL